MANFTKSKAGKFNRGLKQLPRLIIGNSGGANHYFIKRNIGMRILEGQKIDEVWLWEYGNLTEFYKKAEAPK